MKGMKWERERNEEAGSENEGVVKISWVKRATKKKTVN